MICQLDLPSVPALVIHGDPRVRFLRSIRTALDTNTRKLFAAVKQFTGIENNAFLDATVIDMIITGILDSTPDTFAQDVPLHCVQLWADWLDEEIDWNGSDLPSAKTFALFHTIRACLKNHSKYLRQLHRTELNIIRHSRP